MATRCDQSVKLMRACVENVLCTSLTVWDLVDAFFGFGRPTLRQNCRFYFVVSAFLCLVDALFLIWPLPFPRKALRLFFEFGAVSLSGAFNVMDDADKSRGEAV